MKTSLGRGRSPIGLAIGARHIHAVQLCRGRRDETPRLAVAAGFRRAEPGASVSVSELERVRDALDRQGFVGAGVVLVAPGDRIIGGVLDVPPRSSGAPLDQIVRNELARGNRVEASQIECGWWELPPGVRETEGCQVIALACRHEDSLALLEPCTAAGLDVVAIDAPGPALARAVRAKVAGQSGLSGVLEVGAESALLVVLRGGTIVYERLLAEGGTQNTVALLVRKLAVDEQTAEFLLGRVGVDGSDVELADEAELVAEARAVIAESADQLASEVHASAAYAGRRYAEDMQRLLLIGTGAAVPGLGDRIARRLEVPASLATLGDLYPTRENARTSALWSSPAAILAAGLAMHEEGWR